MSSIKCFVLEPTKEVWASLRRYRSSAEKECPGKYGYHNAHFNLGEFNEDKYRDEDLHTAFPKTDERWPKKCEYCDYQFEDKDQWQIFRDHIWIRQDTGEKVSLRNAPAGALYRATWYEPNYAVGKDGQSWCCVLPGGHVWTIDGRASNCTLPNDKEHRCWVRHGVAPDFHIDKNGHTCAAGAGSILAGGYHGFLHNGHLVQC